jgi:hypothetical protein
LRHVGLAGLPALVFVLARVVSGLCLLTPAVVAAFDTQAARFASGTVRPRSPIAWMVA